MRGKVFRNRENKGYKRHARNKSRTNHSGKSKGTGTDSPKDSIKNSERPILAKIFSELASLRCARSKNQKEHRVFQAKYGNNKVLHRPRILDE